MGREVWVYQIKKVKGKKGLDHLLKQEAGFKCSFEDFLKNRRKEFGKNYKYSRILDIVSKDIYQTTPDLLFEITYWLNEVNELDLKDENNLLSQKAGITQIYESSTKSEANAFIIAYYNFLELIPNSIEHLKIFDAGISTPASKFIEFLDYMILFMNQIKNLCHSEIVVDYPMSIKKDIKQILSNRNDDMGLMNKVSISFNRFKDLYNSNKNDPNEKTINNHADFQLMIRNHELVEKILRMKKLICENDAKIIIIDSR